MKYLCNRYCSRNTTNYSYSYTPSKAMNPLCPITAPSGKRPLPKIEMPRLCKLIDICMGILYPLQWSV